MNRSAHLVIVPIVLPLAAGALMLAVDERYLKRKALISGVAMLALVAAALALAAMVDASAPRVYRVGNWPAPFGIVLVADSLSVILVLLASIVGFAALLFSLARWQRAGPQFHSLLHFLLMGVNGCFLTGDLFNLFVFFEVLLAASYGLALHGSGHSRVMSSLHYLTVNLAASLFFLIGAALIYGVTGTLNLADLARSVALVREADRGLLEAGAAIVGLAFLTKAGMWPLCFWLPSTYSAAGAPVAAIFALLTKVGVYVVLRTSALCFGDDAGAAAGFGQDLLLAGGMMTLAFGAVGILAAQDLRRLASYGLLVSAGTLLAAAGLGEAAITGAALYYLIASTLGASALYLLTELLERGRMPGADILAVTAAAFIESESEEALDGEEEAGIAIPAAIAILGVSFACCALVLSGLPPLAGFVGKFALMHALLNAGQTSLASWLLLFLLLLSGLTAIVGFGRAGVRRFWAEAEDVAPRVRVVEMAPVALLLGLCAAITIEAGSVMRHLEHAAAGLHAPHHYIDSVLSRP